ncbi:NAD-dependent epimerase/dehydratase family protein [Pseudoruminococcus massiliensis]|uniref:NAD-dependent epimerase/dehydratase family protein n=1 Tax=Pseudoruminococcus massiliensis TaxID=2086583 RepID=UPI003AB47B79
MSTFETKDYILQEDLDYIANSFPDINKLKNSTILVTGATGLVGSYAVKALAAINRIHNADMKILALVRNPEKAKTVFSKLLERGDISLVIGDVLQKIQTEYKIDYIIHCASVTNSKEMVTKPVETICVAVDGTRNILELAKENDVKSVVYISSMEVYGSPDASLPYVSENDYGYVDILNVRSCYPEGKRMCECLCTSYAHEYNLPIKIARLAQTFGAGVSKNETRVFAQFARSLINEEDIVLHTKGESTGNYCYTRDCILGILYILIRGENGAAYNITNENTNMTIAEMAQMVAEKSGKISVVFDIPKDALQFGYAPSVKMKLSSEKLRSLGWKSDIDLSEMYERMIKSWKNT